MNTDTPHKTVYSDTTFQQHIQGTDDVNLSSQEPLAHGADVSKLERCFTHSINGYCIPAGTP